jgi:Sulfotransferase family
MEDAISHLLGAADTVDNRAMLLAELSGYARAVVAAARRLPQDIPSAMNTAEAWRWLEHPVFICGHHRSGTTLLQQLLDGHPELLVLPSEGTYFTSFDFVARTNPRPRDVDRFIADWIARLVDPNYEPHFNLGRSGPGGNPSLLFARRLLDWHAVLRHTRPALAPLTPLLALAAAYRDVAAPVSQPRLWVEKTPLNERHVQRFAALSQARFIQLVREPGAALASMAERHRTAGNRDFDPAVHAHSIGRSLRLAARHARQFDGRYLIVRYEDLKDDPAREMERVGAFLGVAHSPSLLIPTVAGVVVRSNSSFERGQPGVVHSGRQPLTLDAGYARLVSALAASAAAPLGYDVAQLPACSRSAMQLRQWALYALRRVGAWIRRALRQLQESLG